MKHDLVKLYFIVILLMVTILGVSCIKSNSSIPSPTATHVNSSTNELLLVWGTTKNAEQASCTLWIIYPEENQAKMEDVPWCSHSEAYTDSVVRIMVFPTYLDTLSETTNEILVYIITEERQLALSQTIPLGEVRITAQPQWATNSIIYFSGILENKEKIFRLHIGDNAIESIIDAMDGFATAPQLSPDGKYISYEIWHEQNSRGECTFLNCQTKTYSVWDIEQQRSVDISALIKPSLAGKSYFTQCDFRWAPSSQYVAFTIGCGVQTPGSVVVINLSNYEVQLINGADDQSPINIHKWTVLDTLILDGRVVQENEVFPFEGYFLYSVKNKKIETLLSPYRNNQNSPDWIFIEDWTMDGLYAVGQTQIPGEIRTVKVVIFDMRTSQDTEQYLTVSDTNIDSVLWSSTGQMIAYNSFNWDTRNDLTRVVVVSTTGETIFDSGLTNIINSELMWVTVST